MTFEPDAYLIVQVPGLAHPCEDVVAVGTTHLLACVADGITRDRYEFDVASPALAAARSLVDEVLTVLEDGQELGVSALQRAFDRGNRAVRRLNERLGFIDERGVLAPDCAGAVAAAVAVDKDRTLALGYVGDCLVRIALPKGELLFTTEDQIAPMRAYLEGQRFRNQEMRDVYVRSEVRNNPSARDDSGKPIGFGAFTGDERVGDFLRLHTLRAERGSLVTLASDGAVPLLEDHVATGMLREFQRGVEREEIEDEIRNRIDVLRNDFGRAGDDISIVAFVLT